MIETEILLEKFHWESSQDQSHQFYSCEQNNHIEFENLVIHIRKRGYLVTIQGESYVCVDIGEYLYWIVWDSIEKTSRINRMRI